MVIIDETKERRMIMLDEEIIGSGNPCTTFDRTANGGILFKSSQYDEFGNESVLSIEITGTELQVIKNLFDNGLI